MFRELGTASATGYLKCVSCGTWNSLSDSMLEVCVSCGTRNSLRNLVIEVCVSVLGLELSCVFMDFGTASATVCLKCVSAVGLGTASATGCLKCVSVVGLELACV